MIVKFPIIRPYVGIHDILASAGNMRRPETEGALIRALSGFSRTQDIFLFDSGIACFYLALQALKENSSRTEVVLPAYTAGSLIVAVKKAGLTPVLCDVSLDDFNADMSLMLAAVNANTLAVTAVHMFGIPMHTIDQLRSRLAPEIFLLEDCCQSMGSRVADTACGCFGDISFFSFNRGKNLSAFGGGCICVNKKELAEAIQKQIQRLAQDKRQDAILVLKMLAYRCATDPWIYGLAHGLISRFKENAPPEDIAVERLSRYQAGLAARLLTKADGLFLQRSCNGMYLLEGLQKNKKLILPQLNKKIFPVFNRLPVLCKEAQELAHLQKRLWAAGFESSRMYEKPLHRMFDLGYNDQDFPNSLFLAEHLLTLPVYAGLQERHLDAMIAAMQG